MGKEATIGLTVILILMVTFGVVLARRLGGSADSPEVATAAEDSTTTGDARDGANDGVPATLPDTQSTELRIVTAKPAAEEPLYYAPGTIDDFSPASASLAESPASAAVVDVPPPPMMPTPSSSSWSGIETDYASPLRPAETQTASQTAQYAPAAAEAYDPFPTGSESAATTYVGSADYPPAALPAYEPTAYGPTSYGPTAYEPPASSAVQQTAGTSYADSTSYPSDAGYSAASTQTWRQETPSAYAASPSPITPIPEPSPSRAIGYDVRNPDGSYTVQPNDNYWIISEKLYGTGAYFKALAEHNREKYPQEDRLDMGDVVMAPSIPELEKAYPDLCPKPSRRETVRDRASLVSAPAGYGRRTYVVEEGDTLFDIARYELGKAARWSEILELNRDQLGNDPGYITPGMRLVLPGNDEPTDLLTQRPGESGPLYR